MMGSGLVRNTLLYQINLRNSASRWLSLYEYYVHYKNFMYICPNKISVPYMIMQ